MYVYIYLYIHMYIYIYVYVGMSIWNYIYSHIMYVYLYIYLSNLSIYLSIYLYTYAHGCVCVCSSGWNCWRGIRNQSFKAEKASEPRFWMSEFTDCYSFQCPLAPKLPSHESHTLCQTNIIIDNHHFQWVNPPWMAIMNSCARNYQGV